MSWTFLTNHGQVLLAIARNPTQTMRQLSAMVGITERSTHAIVKTLEQAGYLVRRRVGRSNAYSLQTDRPLPDPLLPDHKLGDLLRLLS